MKRIVAILATATVIAISSSAVAQDIVGATSATVNSGGTTSGTSINDTFNQNGLLTTYTSGSTNFNTYTAGDPQHDLTYFGNEWFSANSATASVTYDLGAIQGIDALALWNEDATGIGSLNLFGSTDDFIYFALGLFNPADNPFAVNYGPEVFGFTAANMRYVRFDMSGCPDDWCSIGEVAFRTAAVDGGVPEPATWAMMLLGFGAIGFRMRRRKPVLQIA